MAANPLTLSPDEAALARQEAWERFVSDYVGCVDDDPGTARARWWAEMASIEALESGHVA